MIHMNITKSLAIAAVLLAVGFAATDAAFADVKRGRPKITTRVAPQPTDFTTLAVIVAGPQKSRLLGGSPQTIDQRLVEDHFFASLIEKDYDVLVRLDLEKIVKDQKLQTKLLNESEASGIGKLLNLPAVMLVEIYMDDEGSEHTFGEPHDTKTIIYEGARLTAKLIDVRTGIALWEGSHFAEVLSHVERDVEIAEFRAGKRSISPGKTGPAIRPGSRALARVAEELADAFPKNRVTEQSSGKPQSDVPQRRRRPGAAFASGSVWEGTQSRVGAEANPIEVKWIVKERDGQKFRAEIEMPMRTLKIEGTVSAGKITWRDQGSNGREGQEQTLSLRGRTITGTINRADREGNAFQNTVSLTLKSE
jgi:hypothetical protein